MSRVEKFKSHYNKIKSLYLKYERLLMPVALVIGFFVDYFTFSNIQISTTIVVFLVYWSVAGITIVFTNLYDGGRLSVKFRYARLFAPLLIQFLFGGLLGGSFIFYWFSGSLSVSWPVIILFVILMLSNDRFRHYLLTPTVQVGAYSFVTLSIFSVILPFKLNSLSPWLFVVAEAVSLFLVILLSVIISLIRKFSLKEKAKLALPAVLVLSVMHVFYFLNLIPPIPLSIREAGVYHSLQRVGNSYKLTEEVESKLSKFLPGQSLHLSSGERAYVYTAIFAPAELNTKIYHHWQYYDENKKEWVSRDRLAFSIIGGRKEGYRGYSWKSGLLEGRWRVDVETERGQVLGRIKFTVQSSQQLVPLEEVIK